MGMKQKPEAMAFGFFERPGVFLFTQNRLLRGESLIRAELSDVFDFIKTKNNQFMIMVTYVYPSCVKVNLIPVGTYRLC
jgi:hypothetical protein